MFNLIIYRMLKETLKIFSHLTIVLLAACGGSESVEKAPMPQPSALSPVHGWVGKWAFIWIAVFSTGLFGCDGVS